MKFIIYFFGVLFVMGAIINFLTGMRKYKKKVCELERRIQYLTQEITDLSQKSGEIISTNINESAKIHENYTYFNKYTEQIQISINLFLDSFDSLKSKISSLSTVVSSDADDEAFQKYMCSINQDIGIIEQQINILHDNRQDSLKYQNNRSQDNGKSR